MSKGTDLSKPKKGYTIKRRPLLTCSTRKEALEGVTIVGAEVKIGSEDSLVESADGKEVGLAEGKVLFHSPKGLVELADGAEVGLAEGKVLSHSPKGLVESADGKEVALAEGIVLSHSPDGCIVGSAYRLMCNR